MQINEFVGESFKFEFDKEFAKKVDVEENYKYITVDVEQYNDEIEIPAGFHKADGRVTEVFLTPVQLEYLFENVERR